MESPKINTTGDREKKCPSCASPFTCSTSECWCSKLPAIMPMEVTGDCYCPACLERIIDIKIRSALS